MTDGMEMDVSRLSSETVSRIKELGHIELTPDAKDVLDENEVELLSIIEQYANFYYGAEVNADGKFENDLARLSHQGKSYGIYDLPDGNKVRIVTTYNVPVTRIEFVVPEPDRGKE